MCGEKTCLPTFSISDVARGLTVKPFGYSEKQLKWDLSREFACRELLALNRTSVRLNQLRPRFRRNRLNPISPTPISAKLTGSGTADALTPETNAVWSPDAVPRNCRS